MKGKRTKCLTLKLKKICVCDISCEIPIQTLSNDTKNKSLWQLENKIWIHLYSMKCKNFGFYLIFLN